jgi:hypothetical protein
VDNELKDRLKSALAASAKSARAISLEATGKPDVVRDILRGKARNPSMDTITAIARVLEIPVSQLAQIGGSEPPTNGAAHNDLRLARVIGVAQAGAFVEVYDNSDSGDDTYIPTVADPRFPHLEPVAFEVAGDSIDEMCKAGGYAVGVNFADSGLQLRADMWVVADRVRGDLVERTIKQVKGSPGRWTLHPASSNPRHKPIRFPSAEAHEEIVIIAVIRRFISPELPL